MVKTPWLTEACGEGSIPWTNLWAREGNTIFTHFTPWQDQFLICWKLQGFYSPINLPFFERFCPKFQSVGLMAGGITLPGWGDHSQGLVMSLGLPQGGDTQTAPPIYAFPLKNGSWTHLFKEKAEMGNKIKRNIVSVTTEEDQFFQGTHLTGRNSVFCWQPSSCNSQGQNPSNSSADFGH